MSTAGTPPPNATPAPVDAAVVAGRGALFIGAAKMFFMLSGSIQQILLARLLARFYSLGSLGAFGAVNSFISIVNNTVLQATVQSVSKFTAEDDRNIQAVKRAALRVQAIVGGTVALVMFLGAPFIADFERAPGYTTYYRIAAVIPFFYALYGVFIGSVNGQRRFRTQAGFDMTFSTAKTVLLLAMAAAAGVAGAFFGFALAALLIVIIAARVIGLPANSGTAAGDAPFPVGRLLRFMAPVGAYTLLLNVALLYDQPLLHRFAASVDVSRGQTVAAHYQALRTLALLPYQALLVVTFVIFPLVSRATFQADRQVTRAYVTQTLRYALILAVAMGLALGARPSALLAIVYGPAFVEGAPALSILVVGECCLALLGVSCAILNAAGRTKAALGFMGLTVSVGIGAANLLVPQAALGQPMLVAAATATAAGMAIGFLASVVHLRSTMGGSPPLRTLARVAAAGAAAVVLGRILPGGGRVVGLAITVLLPIVYLGVLVVLGEFGPEDRAKFKKILRRR